MSGNKDSKQQVAVEGEKKLCHVIKSPTFDGYGFNLHAEKGKPGQYIGKVDEGSPAETAGLKQGDRILEVNGQDISNESHKQVVQRIKALPDETKLLVMRSPSNAANNIGDVDACDAPMVMTTNGANNANGSSKTSSETTTLAESTMNNNGTTDHSLNNGSNNNAKPSGLNLKMTAAELRAQLAAKKKYDPKKESIDFRKKFEIVQKL